jgi:hypothetical protein
MASRGSGFRHTFSAERYWARPKSELFTFHQEEAAAHWSGVPQTGPVKRPEDGEPRLHKTPIYNILPRGGQTGHDQKTATTPYRVGYQTETRMQSDGNMPESLED